MKHEQVGDLIHNAILDAQRYFLNPICLILISVGDKRFEYGQISYSKNPVDNFGDKERDKLWIG